MQEITHWTYDAAWTACMQKLATPYIAYRTRGYGQVPNQKPGFIRLEQMFAPNYVLEARKIEEVNCPACIAVMKLSKWHCVHHGFVQGKDVTFDENCAICGNPV